MDENNYAFIDGQNLYLGINKEDWKLDLEKFRVYLKDKYKVKKAFYFLGYLSDGNSDLYTFLQSCGYIVIFREHSSGMHGNKKGNVDTDIVFEMMRNSFDNKEMDKVVLISGDGDYYKTVRYLIEKNKFKKILFPNSKFASSLYNKIDNKYRIPIRFLKKKLEYKKELK